MRWSSRDENTGDDIARGGNSNGGIEFDWRAAARIAVAATRDRPRDV